MRKSILWIDDDILKLSGFVSALKKENFNVFIAQNYEEALVVMEQNVIDIFLIDIVMEEISGIEIIRTFKQDRIGGVFALLSSFLYRQQFRDEIRTLDMDVQLIDKCFPNVDDPEFINVFINPIKELAIKGVTRPIGKYEKQNTKDNPFKITWNKFIELSVVEKDAYIDKAETIVSKAIEKCFKKGYVWVLFCGDDNEISAYAERDEDILSEEEIIKHAQLKNRVPYQFYHGLSTEDHNWTHCAESGESGENFNMIGYPTINLEINGKQYEFHFDTGCPFSYFSFEELKSISAINDPIMFSKETRKGFPSYRVAPINNMKVILVSQLDGQTTSVNISGRAIRDWFDNSPYLRSRCKDCSISADLRHPKACPLRKALIGRNLIYDNKLQLILDGRNKKTHFIK